MASIKKATKKHDPYVRLAEAMLSDIAMATAIRNAVLDFANHRSVGPVEAFKYTLKKHGFEIRKIP